MRLLSLLSTHPSALQALTSLGCMEHRGACSADADSGDGAGIMTQIPWKLFKEDFPELNERTTGFAVITSSGLLSSSLIRLTRTRLQYECCIAVLESCTMCCTCSNFCCSASASHG